MGHGGAIGKVIDGNHFNLGMIPCCTKDKTPNPSKSVNANFYRHKTSLKCFIFTIASSLGAELSLDLLVN